MKIFTRSLALSYKFCKVANEPVGDVYIWPDKKDANKKLLLPQKARRVSLGKYHTAIVGQSGQICTKHRNLYTYGNNKYGQLGHGDKLDLLHPKMVQYFDKKAIRIKDAVCGQYYTITLTDKGQVYTFGYGGKRVMFLMNLFSQGASPLGHGNQISLDKPHKIKYFQNIKIQRITAGSEFNFASDEEDKMYYWGCGEYGVSGDVKIKNCSVPTLSEYFKYFHEVEKMKVKKMKSCGFFSIALMNNGYLYGWGSNNSGQIGIKSQMGIQLHEMVNYPHQVIREGYQQKKVQNFDISQNLTIFQLQNKQIWWCGRAIAYKPQKINFEVEGESKLFAAGNKSFVIVSNANKLYDVGKFLNTYGKKSDKKGVIVVSGEELFNGKVVGIGGQFDRRYAIVQ